MCIIASKPSGVKMPDEFTLHTMWTNNPDGAGFMYADKGSVYIRKGFMKYDDFKTELNRLAKTHNLDNLAMVFHFRIKTHGDVSPECTHPFPVTEDERLVTKTKLHCSLGVAHNGIINSVFPRKGFSDTMEYVITQLGPLFEGASHFYKNPSLMRMIENSCDSKLAFLTSDGVIYTIGAFTEENGIKYSNSSYKRWSYGYSACGLGTGWSSYGMYDNFDLFDYPKETKCSKSGYASRALYYLWDYEDLTLVSPKGKGEVVLNNDYAVDEDGNLYEYCADVNAMMKLSGYRALDANKTVIRYDKNFADEDLVYDEIVYDPDIAETPFLPEPDETDDEKGSQK